MMLISTGSLTHIRNNAKFPYKVAFVPMNVRNAVPIGGASLVQPAGLDEAKRKAGWTLITWLTAPEKSGWWSRATGYFAPNMGAYDLPAMKEFLAKNPDAKTAIEQLAVAKPWFATYKTVAVRKAIEDELQAVVSGKKQPKEAIVDRAEDGRRNHAALRGADGAEIAARPTKPSLIDRTRRSSAAAFSISLNSIRSHSMLIAQLTDLHLRPPGMAAYRVSETNMMTERAFDARHRACSRGRTLC